MRIIFFIGCLAMSFYILWMGFVLVLSIHSKEKEFSNKENRTIAVMVCARDEEKVIGNLMDSLNGQNYPKENYRVFVVAHNCSDKTGEVAEKKGAEVIVYRNEVHTKASALQYGLDYVCRKYGDRYRYFAVFDADNLVDPDFLKEISRALDEDTDVVSGYYGCKNFSDCLVSGLSGALYYGLMDSTCIPQNKAGLPVNVYGTGYVMKMELREELNNLVSMVEDFELSLRLVMKKKILVMNPHALFYAEMPVNLKEALKQRRRWAFGDKQCFLKYGKKMFQSIPSLGLNGFKEFMDLLIIPLSWMTFLSLFAGFLVYGKSFLSILVLVGIIFYVFFFIVIASSLKRQKQLVGRNPAICILEPFWILLTPLMSIDSLFYKKMEWEKMNRHSFVKIEEVKKKQ